MPGDMITTGTPPGVGLGMKPTRFPQAGRRDDARNRGPGRAAAEGRAVLRLAGAVVITSRHCRAADNAERRNVPRMNKRAEPGAIRAATSSRPPSGCRSPPTGSSRRRRACWRAPRACTTGRPKAARCSTASPGCGASTPATPAEDRRRDPEAGGARWTSRRPSRWATRSPSSSPSALVAHRAAAASTSVFFTNSGSESVDTALKIALAYHRARGEGARIRLIGRERGYHGVNFGGISVGGIAANRKSFGPMLAGVDHLRHTHDLDDATPSRAASRSTAPSSPTTSSGSSRCTTRRPSPR